MYSQSVFIFEVCVTSLSSAAIPRPSPTIKDDESYRLALVSRKEPTKAIMTLSPSTCHPSRATRLTAQHMGLTSKFAVFTKSKTEVTTTATTKTLTKHHSASSHAVLYQFCTISIPGVCQSIINAVARQNFVPAIALAKVIGQIVEAKALKRR